MRRILLWMAGNRWLRQRIPRLPFARRAVLRFMPGEEPEAALRAAERFREQGISTALTRLGENISRAEEGDSVAAHYLGMIDRAASTGLDTEVSVKLTQLGLDLDEERTFAHVKQLAERSATKGRALWIDMEGSAYTGRTIALYERIRREHPNAGVCLQAYLLRTASDLRRLMPLSPAVRLVKGAYAESPAIAYQSRADVDRSFGDLAKTMLDAARDGAAIRIALGTHDVRLIEAAAAYAASIGLAKSAIEVQMLYGIRSDEQLRLARAGFPVRDLICYGAAWYPWYMRRLAERPANVLFALRQLLP